jgi:NADP-dependent 3-hydroxy acid dehydrogenase YdfG/acyl carrier protein
VTGGWRYRIGWVPVTGADPAVLAGPWLVVSPAGPETARGLAEWCGRALAAAGAEVVPVPVAGLDRESLAAGLTAAVAGQNGLDPAGVVSLLGIDERPVTAGSGVSAGLAGTLALVQALGRAGINAPLWVATQGAVTTASAETLAHPGQAMIWGLGRVAALEHPGRWGGLIDLPPALDERAAARLAAVLAGGGEDQVAIRAAGTVARRLGHSTPARSAETYRPAGRALLTGGTGALGGHVARWLAGRGAPTLTLTSRSGPAAAGIAALAAALAAAGTTCEVISCDVADRAAVTGLLARIAADGPPLTAVLHAAGLGHDIALADTTVAELDRLVSAKAAGAAHLDELTAGLDLEQFVLFSSIAATWGSGLQPAYAAANAFLDGLAEWRRAQGRPATSVAWGPWGGGGMTGHEGAAHLERRGLRLMAPDRALHALGLALDGRDTQVTVADVDWARFTPPFTLRRGSPLIEDLPEVQQARSDAAAGPEPGSGEVGAALAGQLAGLPPAEQERALLNVVRAQSALALGHPDADAVEADRQFRDLGFDSLTAVELRDRLTEATGLRLPATLVFDYPTPTALTGYLWAEGFQERTAPASLAGELDRLESLLPQTAGDDATREMVASRLQAILTRLMPNGNAKSESVAQKIGGATDDEIFNFIHKELGRS